MNRRPLAKPDRNLNAGEEMEESKPLNPDAYASEIRFIKIREVLAICGKSRSSVYAAIQKGEFPAPVKVGGRSSAWVKNEVVQWTQNCIRMSRSGVEPSQQQEAAPDD